jgi:5'-deoxynucleotidase
VAVLAHALAVIRNRYFGGRVDEGAVAVAALYHDASEILTGDMPTPIKYYNPDIRDAYKQVESIACHKLLRMLPEELRPAYDGILQPRDQEIERLVKAADKLSAHIKCLEELKAGNLEFKKAAEQTRAALDEYDMPELDYFREHFLGSFELTLDEME